MGEMVDCTCGGSNENCVICGGRGEYRTGIGRRLGAPKRKKPKQMVRPDLLPLVSKFGDAKKKADARKKLAVRVDGPEAKCPHRDCDFRGSRDELYRHMQWSHPNSERRSAEHSNESECRDTMKCPLCDAKLNRADFTIHLGGKHRTSWEVIEQVIQTASERNLSIVQSSRKVKCALCTISVPWKEIDSHLEIQHAIEIEHLRRLVRKKGRKAGTLKSKRHPESKGVVEGTQEDVLEAHRGMGFVIREQGRYGSHPLHDKHDDESMP